MNLQAIDDIKAEQLESQYEISNQVVQKLERLGETKSHDSAYKRTGCPICRTTLYLMEHKKKLVKLKTLEKLLKWLNE